MQNPILSDTPVPLTADFGPSLRAANIGERYWNDKLEDIPEGTPHREGVLQYLANLPKTHLDGCGFLLHGPHGTGKTSILSVMLIEVMRRGNVRAWFQPFASVDWFARHRDAVGSNGVPVWKMLTTYPFVSLDDIGSERNAEWNDCWLEEIMRERYNRRLPTFLATNVELPPLLKRCTFLPTLLAGSYTTILVDGVNWRE